MASMGIQVLGISLSIIGWLGSLVCCILPMWKVAISQEDNILLSKRIWEGLWMNCVMQSTGQMQCTQYEAILGLPQDIQAGRALVVIAIVLAVVGTCFAILGGKCTNCVEEEVPKTRVIIAAGVFFILSGFLLLIPLCWTTHAIIQDFHNPMLAYNQRRDFGPSLFIGWASSSLLIIGGALLCCNCPPKSEKPYSAKYMAARSVPASNYV
ncbi:claudin-4-like [Podarcis raffonei]|uniref:claudin-4-like n=1 Tax=Podarcis raffonei TaxID=65483 RepID=UPI0023292206|nr:claudin-4-like [Podarcis raffonei]